MKAATREVDELMNGGVIEIDISGVRNIVTGVRNFESQTLLSNCKSGR